MSHPRWCSSIWGLVTFLCNWSFQCTFLTIHVNSRLRLQWYLHALSFPTRKSTYMLTTGSIEVTKSISRSKTPFGTTKLHMKLATRLSINVFFPVKFWISGRHWNFALAESRPLYVITHSLSIHWQLLPRFQIPLEREIYCTVQVNLHWSICLFYIYSRPYANFQ